MWLINAHTRRLEYFEGVPPPYAILSHRWEREEVTFQEIQSGQGLSKDGYRKIELSCQQALREERWFNWHTGREGLRDNGDLLEYVWVDTCCIDKTNSAELSEAINSMFKWYREAAVCYAFLSDVDHPGEKGFMQDSRWWTRGWTLQELLAPWDVHFYGYTWDKLGQKLELDETISNITGIPKRALLGFSPGSFSVGDIMSWASRRTTTREEDLAYCLLGLLEVNMPLIYGEGRRAFQRLQEEVVKNKDDTTIFAWNSATQSVTSLFYNTTSVDPSIFARSPEYFDHWFKELTPVWRSTITEVESILGTTMTGRGLAITLDMIPIHHNTYLVPICYIYDGTQRRQKGMLLERWKDGLFRRMYSRADHVDGWLFDVPDRPVIALESRRVVISPALVLTSTEKLFDGSLTYGFNINCELKGISKLYSRAKIKSTTNTWEPNIAVPSGSPGVAGMVSHTGTARASNSSPTTVFIFGFDFDFNHFCLAVRHDTGEGLVALKDIVVSVDRLGIEQFRVTSNVDTMRLVSKMQANEKENLHLASDGVELQVKPWRETKKILRFSTGENVFMRFDNPAMTARISWDTGGEQSSNTTDEWHLVA